MLTSNITSELRLHVNVFYIDGSVPFLPSTGVYLGFFLTLMDSIKPISASVTVCQCMSFAGVSAPFSFSLFEWCSALRKSSPWPSSHFPGAQILLIQNDIGKPFGEHISSEWSFSGLRQRSSNLPCQNARPKSLVLYLFKRWLPCRS